MPLIVSPNLTADRTIRLPRLVPGTVMRPGHAQVTAGSKGVNVARVLATLGRPAQLVGFLPDEDAEVTRRLFDREPLELIGVPVSGSLRVATIYLEDDGRVTVLNEPGPEVDEVAWAQLEATVRRRLAGQRAPHVACSGSLPPGAPVDGYGRLAGLVHAVGGQLVVDAARDVLVASLAAAPDLVAPNLAEAEAALGRGVDEAVDEQGPEVPQRAARAARELVDAGASTAVVTVGAAGAVCATREGAWYFPAVLVDVASPIGAGDSFVAGYLDARERGQPMLDAVAAGLGAATASCEQTLAGGIEKQRAEELAGIIVSGRRRIDGGTGS